MPSAQAKSSALSFTVEKAGRVAYVESNTGDDQTNSSNNNDNMTEFEKIHAEYLKQIKEAQQEQMAAQEANKPESKQEVKQEPKPESIQEVKPESKPESIQEVKQEIQPEAVAQAPKPVVQSESNQEAPQESVDKVVKVIPNNKQDKETDDQLLDKALNAVDNEVVTPKTKPIKTGKNGALTISDTQIDVDFIRKEEGKALKGYVPLSRKSQSGVTIGHGFDLGQINEREFSDMGFSKTLNQKLRPYVGLKQRAAEHKLKALPLNINTDELQEIDAASKNRILKALVKLYNKSSEVSFTDLPREAQTVIFSYAYQYGPYSYLTKSQSGKLWKHFLDQDWNKASTMLRGFKAYASRRSREAQLLDQLA